MGRLPGVRRDVTGYTTCSLPTRPGDATIREKKGTGLMCAKPTPTPKTQPPQKPPTSVGRRIPALRLDASGRYADGRRCMAGIAQMSPVPFFQIYRV